MPEPVRRLVLVEERPPPASTILPLEARRLVYEAGGRRLIDGVDLLVEPGRRLVVIGPNGAGKSLLLRLLHGLIEPLSGEIRWRGRAADRAIRSRQAMVFQKPVLLRRSVAANIDYALRAQGVPAADRPDRLARALQRGRLTALANRPARVLSGGEQQRLALVRALAVEPEILFLDEPTASLAGQIVI
jgi:tungstate transport system ATP-binding protein